MKIAVIVESVFNRVNGWKPSTDSSILMVDIRALLPVAINYSLDASYNINIKTEGDRDLPSEFYGVYEGTTVQRVDGRTFITLQKGTVPLKGNAGVRFVYDNCDNYYAPLSDSDMATINHWNKISDSKYYRRKSNKLDLYGTNPLVEEINYQAITDINELLDTDEAPIQAGQETQVMDILFNLITKGIPYDGKIDSADITESPYK